jgi:hypothetical protein
MPSWSDVLSVINLAAVLAVGVYLTSFKKYWEKYWEKRAEVQATKDDFNEVLRQAKEIAEAVKRLENAYYTVGQSDLEFRKLQLSELYGPLYSYTKLQEKLVQIWKTGKLNEIDTGIRAFLKQQNERITDILATKLHLVEGAEVPSCFAALVTSVTVWNLYTSRPDQHWIPADVAALPGVQYPEEFNQYIYQTTEGLKKKLHELHQKYGIEPTQD